MVIRRILLSFFLMFSSFTLSIDSVQIATLHEVLASDLCFYDDDDDDDDDDHDPDDDYDDDGKIFSV